MKIVNLTKFLALPAQTLFAKYEPCVFEALEIKLCNVGESDFCSQQIADAIHSKDSGDFGWKLENARENGASIPLDLDCAGRDGCFVDDQLFAVYEAADVAAIIERLKQCINP